MIPNLCPLVYPHFLSNLPLIRGEKRPRRATLSVATAVEKGEKRPPRPPLVRGEKRPAPLGRGRRGSRATLTVATAVEKG